MDLTANEFMRASTIALEDIQLHTALQRGTGNADGRRRQVMAEINAQALRQQARGAKLRALHELPDLLEQLERNITAKGGHVLWAADAEEANRHIIDICQKHNLKRGVKSKSMITEEIGMLEALKEAGIKMLETDLGEFIVQVSESHPSHVVMPVMHMTKEQIRDLFMKKLDMPYTDEASEMTAFARKLLREEYIQADFGMSGGNFLIAETGTVAIVTNEGNGRLSTGVPPVHIAVVGIEKVVPTWEDFITLVQMLPRAATGTKMTVYVNMFNAPASDDEPDGPQEFYLVLVDNGRSSVYASEYTEVLACIRCGACQNVCPVYKNVGGHAYGWVYGGPIGALVTPLLNGKENAEYLPFASSLCGACKQACPVDINIPDLLLKLRRDLEHTQDPIWKIAMKGFAIGNRYPLLFETGGKIASYVTRTAAELSSSDHLEALPYPLNGWTDKRDFPAFAPRSFHDWWRENRGV